MAATTISTFTALGGKLVTDDDISSGISNATGATSGRIYMVECDNTLNISAMYLKIIDAAQTSTGTTTANGSGTPHLMFYLPKGKSITYVIPEGHAYTAGVSVWCVSDPAVGNEIAPENKVKINLICS
tara:strand:+ start:847 stop:1230 length:384 start_codon:yes stop_codon:yes gene_type:complete